MNNAKSQGVTLEYAAYGRLGEAFPDMDFDDHPQKKELIAAVMDIAQQFSLSELSTVRDELTTYRTMVADRGYKALEKKQHKKAREHGFSLTSTDDCIQIVRKNIARAESQRHEAKEAKDAVKH